MPRYVEGASGGNSCNSNDGGGGGDRHKGGGGGGTSSGSMNWQHSDRVLVEEGVIFNVRYIGCLEIKASMKLLDFTTRSQVAKECINRVCEAASLITPKKRRIDKRIEQCMSENALMKHTGTDVKLTVCSKFLMLKNLETNEVLSRHDMPRISFASGGDTDTLDFVAFVAKNLDEWRACYVLECGGGLAKNLISTIGQAFDLRYNEYFVKTQETENLNSDKDYYNDLPDKLPPEMLEAGCSAATAAAGGACSVQSSSSGNRLPPAASSSISIAQSHKKKSRDRLSSNLIDLNSPPHDHDYVNDKQLDLAAAASASAGGANGGGSQQQHNAGGAASAASAVAPLTPAPRDVFDMQPFANTFNNLTAEVQRSQLLTETWFHGLISRPIAESMLKQDGEFLVRESRAKPGQYVLTGMQQASPKHLLLIDPAGVVRTKDRFFDSISHLINYHWNNALPIISEESSLVLRHPIRRPKDQRPA